MRPTQPDTEAVNADSFLDIVASVVSIMIIMVMMVGMRIKNAPIVAVSDALRSAHVDLSREQTTEQGLEQDVRQTAREIENVERETVLRARQRDVLALASSAAEHKIQTRRQQMGAGRQQDFDLARGVAELKGHIEQLQRQRVQVDSAPAEPIVVESYPTPLSQAVHGQEAHFQLRGGRIALIPLDELVVRLKESVRRNRDRLLSQPEFTETIGPLDGFRMRYTMERYDISQERAMETGRGGSYARLKRWVLLPVSDELGEPLDQALADGSALRHALSTLRPDRNTITIWTYGDSFSEFRRLKQELYRLGFSVAGRPLSEGSPISGSPEGSKSAAE